MTMTAADRTADRRKAAKGEDRPGQESIVLKDRYEIFPGRPIDDLASPSARAFQVRDRRNSRTDLYALLCPADLPPRMDALESLHNRETPAVVGPKDWGWVAWPGRPEPAMVVILSRPRGRRLADRSGNGLTPLGERALKTVVIAPLLRALKSLKGQRLTHRAIRVDNLYFGDEEEKSLILGECVSVPPGHDQPVLYETIECGMAEPAARGSGTPADDIYALGIVVLSMALGRLPMDPDDAHGVLMAKLEKSTYHALAAGRGLSSAIDGVVRGLLADDPAQRWTIDDLETWLNEQRLRTVLITPPKRAKMALRIGDVACRNHRMLSYAMARDRGAALEAIRSDSIVKWYRVALNDAAMAEEIAMTANLSPPSGPFAGSAAEDQMLARLCMVVDPHAPIRYRSIASMIDGIGVLFATRMRRKADVQELAELLDGELPIAWLNRQRGAESRMSTLSKPYLRLAAFVRDTAPGFGIERCLYELNSSFPCISPLLAGRNVVKLADLLPALEEIMSEGDPPSRPVDRHVAAFVASRLKADAREALSEMANQKDPNVALFGMLKLLALVQETVGSPPTPGLGRWFAKRLKPVIRTFRSKPLRQFLETRLEKLADSGNLRDLLSLLGDPELERRDREGFRKARREYAAIAEECRAIEGTLDARRRAAVRLGRQVGAAISGFAASATAAGGVLLNL